MAQVLTPNHLLPKEKGLDRPKKVYKTKKALAQLDGKSKDDHGPGKKLKLEHQGSDTLLQGTSHLPRDRSPASTLDLSASTGKKKANGLVKTEDVGSQARAAPSVAGRASPGKKLATPNGAHQPSESSSLAIRRRDPATYLVAIHATLGQQDYQKYLKALMFFLRGRSSRSELEASIRPLLIRRIGGTKPALRRSMNETRSSSFGLAVGDKLLHAHNHLIKCVIHNAQASGPFEGAIAGTTDAAATGLALALSLGTAGRSRLGPTYSKRTAGIPLRTGESSGSDRLYDLKQDLLELGDRTKKRLRRLARRSDIINAVGLTGVGDASSASLVANAVSHPLQTVRPFQLGGVGNGAAINLSGSTSSKGQTLGMGTLTGRHSSSLVDFAPMRPQMLKLKKLSSHAIEPMLLAGAKGHGKDLLNPDVVSTGLQALRQKDQKVARDLLSTARKIEPFTPTSLQRSLIENPPLLCASPWRPTDDAPDPKDRRLGTLPNVHDVETRAAIACCEHQLAGASAGVGQLIRDATEQWVSMILTEAIARTRRDPRADTGTNSRPLTPMSLDKSLSSQDDDRNASQAGPAPSEITCDIITELLETHHADVVEECKVREHALIRENGQASHLRDTVGLPTPPPEANDKSHSSRGSPRDERLFKRSFSRRTSPIDTAINLDSESDEESTKGDDLWQDEPDQAAEKSTAKARDDEIRLLHLSLLPSAEAARLEKPDWGLPSLAVCWDRRRAWNWDEYDAGGQPEKHLRDRVQDSRREAQSRSMIRPSPYSKSSMTRLEEAQSAAKQWQATALTTFEHLWLFEHGAHDKMSTIPSGAPSVAEQPKNVELDRELAERRREKVCVADGALPPLINLEELVYQTTRDDGGSAYDGVTALGSLPATYKALRAILQKAQVPESSSPGTTRLEVKGHDTPSQSLSTTDATSFNKLAQTTLSAAATTTATAKRKDGPLCDVVHPRRLFDDLF